MIDKLHTGISKETWIHASPRRSMERLYSLFSSFLEIHLSLPNLIPHSAFRITHYFFAALAASRARAMRAFFLF